MRERKKERNHHRLILITILKVSSLSLTLNPHDPSVLASIPNFTMSPFNADLSLCCSTKTSLSLYVCRRPKENIVSRFDLTSHTVTSMNYSSYFNDFVHGKQIAVLQLYIDVLYP